jgi:hypothetical protein
MDQASAVAGLCEVLPPAGPGASVVDWPQIEDSLGTALPPDYKAFITHRTTSSNRAVLPYGGRLSPKEALFRQ